MRLVVAALSAALLLAACGHATATDTAVTQATTFNAADVQFLQDMIRHHQQAIEMATLVQGRSRRPQLVRFATSLAGIRAAEVSAMRRWLTQWGRPAPPAPAMGGAGKDVPGILDRGQLDWLKVVKGSRFDLGFQTMMRIHHEGAIEVAQAELRSGASAEVKALARQIIKVQEADIRRLHEWHDT